MCSESKLSFISISLSFKISLVVDGCLPTGQTTGTLQVADKVIGEDQETGMTAVHRHEMLAHGGLSTVQLEILLVY